MNELLKIFEGKVELTDEVKEQLSTLWEAKVAELQSDMEAKTEKYIEEEVLPMYEEKNKEYLDHVVMDQVNSYVTEAVASFTKKHAKELEGYAVSEASHGLLGKMKEVFESASIQIPEGKQDELDAAQARVKSLEEKVEDLMQANTESQSKIHEMRKEQIIADVKEGLTDFQGEKLNSLLEGVATDDLEVFESKAKILRESVEGAAPENKTGEEENKDKQQLGESEEYDEWTANLLSRVKNQS